MVSHPNSSETSSEIAGLQSMYEQNVFKKAALHVIAPRSLSLAVSSNDLNKVYLMYLFLLVFALYSISNVISKEVTMLNDEQTSIPRNTFMPPGFSTLLQWP